MPTWRSRFRTLFRRLGPGLDGPGGFDDADVWYCILEGTAEVAVAEAQARALADLLASHVTGGPSGQVLLAVDEFSAVSRRLPIWQLYERARSLGLAVQVSAQSWHGLAAREDDRYRLAATAEGGIWLLRTPHPEPLTALAGQRAATDSSRQPAGRLRWSRHGTSRIRPCRSRTRTWSGAWTSVRSPTCTRVAPRSPRSSAWWPDRRRWRAGRAAAVSCRIPGRGGGTASASTARAGAALPDVTALLDEAFGPAPS